MNALTEAKARLETERNKIVEALNSILGSRWLLAILAAFMIAFGTHALFFPERLPPVQSLSAADIGLPGDVDFGVVGEQAREAAEAAQRQDVGAYARDYAAADPERIALINTVGFSLALALLILNIVIAAKRYRRGYAVFVPRKRRP
jgi:hypothetical protein